MFNQPADSVARLLLGCEIVVTHKDGICTGGVIVETEAYDEHDEASHSFNGKTRRNGAMFGPPGMVYVYFTYGIHYCLNISTSDEGRGEAVLIRAIEPTRGFDAMWRRRYGVDMPAEPTSAKTLNLTNGPAKLTQALGISLSHNGLMLGDTSLINISDQRAYPITDSDITQTKRVGITRAVDQPRRWFITQSPSVSRKLPLK